MSHVKIGDFLILTSILRQIVQTHGATVRIEVPEALRALYREHKILPELPVHPEPNRIIDLSYPLLPAALPSHVERLSEAPFESPRHVGTSYAFALAEFFTDSDITAAPQPYLEFDLNPEVINHLGLKPFNYFTVHAGSDFMPKNWPNENFENTVREVHSRYPRLKCVGLVGPSDQPLFTNLDPAWFQNIRRPLEIVAQVLAGAVFHIDNDSGIHHLAGVMDVPSNTVWGPTGPGTWRSLSERNFVHWGGPNCTDHCAGSRMKTCPDRVCLTSVRPAELLRSVDQILSAYELPT